MDVPRTNFYRCIKQKENKSSFSKQERLYEDIIKGISIKSNERFGFRKIKVKKVKQRNMFVYIRVSDLVIICN